MVTICVKCGAIGIGEETLGVECNCGGFMEELTDMSLAQAKDIKKKEMEEYLEKMMDKIDNAKKREAYNDLSVIAYDLVNKLASTL